MNKIFPHFYAIFDKFYYTYLITKLLNNSSRILKHYNDAIAFFQ